jgi:hypothetical protein
MTTGIDHASRPLSRRTILRAGLLGAASLGFDRFGVRSAYADCSCYCAQFEMGSIGNNGDTTWYYLAQCCNPNDPNDVCCITSSVDLTTVTNVPVSCTAAACNSATLDPGCVLTGNFRCPWPTPQTMCPPVPSKQLPPMSSKAMPAARLGNAVRHCHMFRRTEATDGKAAIVTGDFKQKAPPAGYTWNITSQYASFPGTTGRTVYARLHLIQWTTPGKPNCLVAGIGRELTMKPGAATVSMRSNHHDPGKKYYEIFDPTTASPIYYHVLAASE